MSIAPNTPVLVGVGQIVSHWRPGSGEAAPSPRSLRAEAARRVLDHLRRLGGTPNEWAFIDAAAEDRRPLLRKICATCRGMGVGKAYAEGIARRQHGVERRLEMMDMGELYAVAGALARTQAHRK